MSASFEIEADFRTDEGKGASRRLRRTGKIPAILYGGGEPPRSLTLDHDDLLHHLEHEAFYSHILTLTVGDLKQKAILKDLQRHPARRAVLHVDFQRVVATEKLKLNVPLHFLGEDRAPGRREGGIISHLVSDVEISCLPADLPEYLEVDVSEAELDAVMHLSDIKMPDGVELTDLAFGGDDQPILTLTRPKAEEEEPTEEGLEEIAPEAGADADAEPEDSGED